MVKRQLYRGYDIYHRHFGRSRLPFNVDVPFLRWSGKRIIAHYHGDDIRGKRENAFMKGFAHSKLVSTPDLLTYVPEAVWIPNPMDMSIYETYAQEPGASERGPVHIVHAPTASEAKGTRYVLEAIEGLRHQGYEIRLSLIEHAPHSEVLQALSGADIVVDQIALQAGWYGVFACEAMAYKKPVCVYIQDDLEQKYLPSRPVMNINPSNMTDRLRSLIEDRELRLDLAQRGYDYVKEVHDAVKVTKKVLEFYGI